MTIPTYDFWHYSPNIFMFINLVYYTEVPTIYRTNYVDLTSDPGTDFLAKVECHSRGSIPTNVTWWRNDIEVDVDNVSYQTVQRVTQQRGSYFQNILFIRDLFGAFGSHNYTCSIVNHFGNDSGIIRFSKQGNSSQVL